MTRQIRYPFENRNETDPVSCSGLSDGNALVTHSGGNTAFTYVWDNGEANAAASILGAGLHNVTVTDNRGYWKRNSVVVVVQNLSLISVVLVANHG